MMDVVVVLAMMVNGNLSDWVIFDAESECVMMLGMKTQFLVNQVC